ncbi:MAG: AfsR/SARP family transcriptional regulator, partial [Actinomycetota bacterium]
MEFRVLGPIEVEVGGEVVAVPAARQRALLALLLVHAGEVLSADRIIEDLWGEDLPSSGASALRFHVSKLRSVLGVDPSPIVTSGSGYVLEIGPESIDAGRFEERLAEALDVMRDDPEQAGSLLSEALSLWRGEPFSGLGDPSFVDAEVRRLNERRAQAVEMQFAAELASGRHADIVGDLEAMVAGSPYRERLWAHLMVALYRSGRQVAALQVFRRASEALGEVGIEP